MCRSDEARARSHASLQLSSHADRVREGFGKQTHDGLEG
jgi:hypothetical protein